MTYETKQTRWLPPEFTVSSSENEHEQALFHGPNAKERAERYASCMNDQNRQGHQAADVLDSDEATKSAASIHADHTGADNADEEIAASADPCNQLIRTAK